MRKIAVIGLGYVGLPLTLAFAQKCKVLGFDKKAARINELNRYYDRNHEMTEAMLKNKNLTFTHDPEDLKKADFFIVACPATGHQFPVRWNQDKVRHAENRGVRRLFLHDGIQRIVVLEIREIGVPGLSRHDLVFG